MSPFSPETQRNTARRHAQRPALALIALVVAIAGCGDTRNPVAPVSGKVLLAGEPVSNAKVVFMPTGRGDNNEAGFSSKGSTDAEGNFTLATVEASPRNGAVVGEHRVMVTTRKTSEDPNNPDRTVVDQEESIPKPYNSFRTSPLRFTVPAEGTSTADFSIE